MSSHTITNQPRNRVTSSPQRGHRRRSVVRHDANCANCGTATTLPFKPTMVNVKPSRIGGLQDLLETYEWCEKQGIGMYGGGQAEQSVGRGQIQYLGSLFHPHTPNDTAPGGYNDPEVPDGLPTSPMDAVPSETGFRWAE